MKAVKEIHAGGYYVFSGRSNANSCFIESLRDAKQFMIYGKYFLKRYLKIHDYVINRDGWVMVVKIGVEREIRENSGDKDGEIWRIISERMRLFLSAFVRVTNGKKGRTGCLVHSSYERYYFDSYKEAMIVLEEVRKQQFKIYRGKKKYRGLKTHYRLEKLGKGTIFLCSREILRKKSGDGRDVGGAVFIGLSDFIVQKLVNNTKISHNPTIAPNTPIFKPIQSKKSSL